ncbi:MAG: hypothetical protein PVF89_06635 [Lysobacterales bacterium]|jgi:hypothetical protein
MSQMDNMPDIRMDAANLSREEIYSDGRVGTIRKLIPVSVTGEPDDSRRVQYIGSTQILTPAGPLPLNFEIPGESLAAAVDGFADAAKAAVERTMKELKELQREQASSIVVPGREDSKIQFP